MTDTTVFVRDIIEQSEHKNPTALGDAFKKAISIKLARSLAEKKKILAQNMFEAKAKKETFEPDDESDDEDDVDGEDDSQARLRNSKVKFTNDLDDDESDDEDDEEDV